MIPKKKNFRASGRVFVGRIVADGRQVAIKKMIVYLQVKDDILINEVVTMRNSSHPNLVNFINCHLRK